jgi:hypothetical protein
MKDYFVNCLEERKLPIKCPGRMCSLDCLMLLQLLILAHFVLIVRVISYF